MEEYCKINFEWKANSIYLGLKLIVNSIGKWGRGWRAEGYVCAHTYSRLDSASGTKLCANNNQLKTLKNLKKNIQDDVSSFL